jgi:hypothetical protein
MENLVLVAIMVAMLVIVIGVAGYFLFSPGQPNTGTGATPGTPDSTTGAGSGSILGPFERNNPDIGQPPSPG